ncbi:MAG: S-layer homology domain-containing protein, partial [Oscillospiraceae bacterium]|nr:S-layer homology domain-containing protein [Oscillospiraceae bacterium]
MKHTKKRVAALLLTLAMVLSLMPAAFAADTDFPDMPAENEASYAAVKSAVDNEIMTGENGMLNLEGTILRSTVSKMVVTAFAAKGEADLSGYPDVAEGAWYVDWMAKANQMGIMSGTSGKMNPSNEVTLAEVAAMLVRALGLPMDKTATLDGVADWAAPYIKALIDAGYISAEAAADAGKPMTRGAFAEVIYKVSGGNYVKEAGEITEDAEGNIVITADGVSLKGITVKGDVIIADGVDAGSIVLDDVKIEGRLVVRGGAEASLTNGTTASATVVAKTSGEVTVKADDSSDAGKIDVAGTNSKAPEKVTLDMAEPNATISTDTAVAVQNAKGGEVTMASANVSLTIESGTLDNVIVSDGMDEVKVEVAEGATI